MLIRVRGIGDLGILGERLLELGGGEKSVFGYVVAETVGGLGIHGVA